jgi:hypothetical protein
MSHDFHDLARLRAALDQHGCTGMATAVERRLWWQISLARQHLKGLRQRCTIVRAAVRVGEHQAILFPLIGQLFRAKFRAALRQMAWVGQVDACIWAKPWVVDCRSVGSGASALKYLAPYIFRIALNNNRIEQVANDTVTFRYTEGKTDALKRATLSVDRFIGRFLAHVLPKGFVKVRYYGLLAVGKRKLLAEVQSILALQQPAPSQLCAVATPESLVAVPDVRRCPSCGQPMQVVQTLPAKRQQERPAMTVGEPSSRGPPKSLEWALSVAS